MTNILKNKEISDWINHSTSIKTIITDRDKGLLSAQDLMFPSAFKRYCGRHLLGNIPGPAFDDQCNNVFWSAVKANTFHEFDTAKNNIKALRPISYEY